MDRDIYQKQYDFELEQRNVIASSTNAPVVSITVIGGALSSMLLAFPYSSGAIAFAFLGFAGLSAISAIVALVYIFRSVIGYSYQKIPSATALTTHFEGLKSWHRANGTSSDQVASESKRDFDAYFEVRLSEAADHNSDNNLRRGNYIHDSTVAIALALAFMGLCSPFFLYAKARSTDGTHKVEVVNPVVLLTSEVANMAGSSNNGNAGGSGSQSATPAQQPTAPAQTTQAKPSGPPNVVFKGGVSSTAKTTGTAKVISTGRSENSKK